MHRSAKRGRRDFGGYNSKVWSKGRRMGFEVAAAHERAGWAVPRSRHISWVGRRRPETRKTLVQRPRRWYGLTDGNLEAP